MLTLEKGLEICIEHPGVKRNLEDVFLPEGTASAKSSSGLSLRVVGTGGGLEGRARGPTWVGMDEQRWVSRST